MQSLLLERANLQEMKDNMIQFSSSLLQDYIETPVETLWSQIHNHLLHLLNTLFHLKWSTITIVSRGLTIPSNSWEDMSKTHITKPDQLIYLYIGLYLKSLRDKYKENVEDLIISTCLTIHDSYETSKKKKLFR